MDWNTIAILITIIGCFLGLAGWLTTRDKKVSSDGEWKGTVNTKLDMILGITDRVGTVENDIRKLSDRTTKVETRLNAHLDSVKGE